MSRRQIQICFIQFLPINNTVKEFQRLQMKDQSSTFLSCSDITSQELGWPSWSGKSNGFFLVLQTEECVTGFLRWVN